MLRSAATPNRTQVHHEPPMKQNATRSPKPTPVAPDRSRTPPPVHKMQRKLPIGVHLFKG